MNNVSNETKLRNIPLDIIRIVAITAVIMIHVSAGFVVNYDIESSEFIFGNIFDSISRIGVPLFVMTSGALMLDENRTLSIKELFLKRILRLVILLIVWSGLYVLAYQIILPLLQGEGLNFRSIISALVFGHYHLWYLYMQIGLYMALPFFKCFVCKKNKNLVLLYLCISILTQFTIPVLKATALYFDGANSLIIFIDKFHLRYFNIYISYFLAGWYITFVGISHRIRRILIYGVALLSIIITIVYVSITKDYINAYSNENILIFLYSIGVFLALNNLKRVPKRKQAITLLSKCSFGMYVIHIAVLTVMNYVLPNSIAAPIYMVISFIFTFSISFLATLILSKTPLVKKIVRM